MHTEGGIRNLITKPLFIKRLNFGALNSQVKTKVNEIELSFFNGPIIAGFTPLYICKRCKPLTGSMNTIVVILAESEKIPGESLI